MTSLPIQLQVEPTPAQFLFTVRGPLAAKDLEAGRQAHNMAAGSDQGVAAARSFSDLSHAVYVPAKTNGATGAGELLIIDYWSNPAGIGTFFSDPQVQEGGKLIYSDREAVIWERTPGLPHFSLPAPAGKNDRWVGLARGPIESREKAEKILTEALRKRANISRAKGLMSREWFFRLGRPGEKAPLEAIGVDVWFDAAGMQEVYADPAEMDVLDGLFTGMPDTSVWQKPKGQWVEW
jgi:hypothetical protein